MALFRFLATAILVVVAAAVARVARVPLATAVERAKASDAEQTDEVMLLPHSGAVGALSAGYRGMVSDILWFYGTAYFGRHYRSDRLYRWLYHYCDLVTTLDPSKLHVYRFGALMLAWESNEPERAVELLTKARSALPDSWEVPYLRGFIYYHFLRDVRRALLDFHAAARLPQADPILPGLVRRIAEAEFSPEIGERLLEGLLAVAKDPTMKEAIESRLRVLRSHRGDPRGAKTPDS